MFYRSLVFALTVTLQQGAAHGFETRDKKHHNLNPARLRQTRAAPKIIGGRPADEDEYPFFVQAEGCGGSLVWKDIVLTAAHCEGAYYDKVLVGGSTGYHQKVSPSSTQKKSERRTRMSLPFLTFHV